MASVLIASNDPNVISPLSKILLKHEWRILGTNTDSWSILSLLDKETFLLILDFNLPKDINVALIDFIREHYPKLKIIVLSAEYSIEFRKHVAEKGIFYCAIKPLDLDEIEELICAIERHSGKENWSARRMNWELKESRPFS